MGSIRNYQCTETKRTAKGTPGVRYSRLPSSRNRKSSKPRHPDALRADPPTVKVCMKLSMELTALARSASVRTLFPDARQGNEARFLGNWIVRETKDSAGHRRPRRRSSTPVLAFSTRATGSNEVLSTL